MNRKALAGFLKSFPSPHCYENYLLCKGLKECFQNPECRLQGGVKVLLSTEARLHGAWLRALEGPRQTTGSSKAGCSMKEGEQGDEGEAGQAEASSAKAQLHGT